MYDALYERMETNDHYCLVRQRAQAEKDVQQVMLIKDKNGNVLTSEESMLGLGRSSGSKAKR